MMQLTTDRALLRLGWIGWDEEAGVYLGREPEHHTRRPSPLRRLGYYQLVRKIDTSALGQPGQWTRRFRAPDDATAVSMARGMIARSRTLRTAVTR